MRVLVTGANGYVGKYVVDELIKNNYEVSCFLKYNTPLSHLNDKDVEIFRGDILDKNSINNSLKDVEAVIHLAAMMREKDYEKNYNVNTKGTQNLIEACRENHIKRFIFTSSVTAIRKQRGAYGKTKRLAEKFIEVSNLDYTILRPTLIYGLESRGLNNIISFIKFFPFVIPLIGDGKWTRQPVSVFDVAKTIVSNLKNKRTFCKTYSIAGKEVLAFRDLVEMIATHLNIKKKFIHIPASICKKVIKFLEFLPVKLPITSENILSLTENTQMDISSLQRDTSFNPVSLKEGLIPILDQLR